LTGIHRLLVTKF